MASHGFEEILGECGVQPHIASVLMSAGWTIENFSCVASDENAMDTIWDELVPDTDLPLLQKSALRAAFKRCCTKLDHVSLMEIRHHIVQDPALIRTAPSLTQSRRLVLEALPPSSSQSKSLTFSPPLVKLKLVTLSPSHAAKVFAFFCFPPPTDSLPPLSIFYALFVPSAMACLASAPPHWT